LSLRKRMNNIEKIITIRIRRRVPSPLRSLLSFSPRSRVVYTRALLETSSYTLRNCSGGGVATAAAAFTRFVFLSRAAAACWVECIYVVRYACALYTCIYIFLFLVYAVRLTPRPQSPVTLPRCASLPRSCYIMTLPLPEWQP